MTALTQAVLVFAAAFAGTVHLVSWELLKAKKRRESGRLDSISQR